MCSQTNCVKHSKYKAQKWIVYTKVSQEFRGEIDLLGFQMLGKALLEVVIFHFIFEITIVIERK